jgi:hypothetical protein
MYHLTEGETKMARARIMNRARRSTELALEFFSYSLFQQHHTVLTHTGSFIGNCLPGLPGP